MAWGEPIKRGNTHERWYVLGIVVGACLFLYPKTFILPSAPIYAGDNAPVFLLDALRMRGGQVIYRDFFELTFPGAPLVYLALFKLFGLRAWIPSALLVLLGAGLAGLSVVIAKRVIDGAAALLPGLLLLTFAFGNALDATHHWLSVLAVTAAMAVLIEKRTGARLAAAGALSGAATLATQSRGVLALAALALFSCWECRRRQMNWRRVLRAEAALSAGFLAVVAPVVVYFGRQAGWSRFVYCTLTFVRKYYPAFHRNNPGVYMVDVPEFSSWVNLPAWGIWLFIHGLVPLVFLLFFVRYRQRTTDAPQAPWDRLMLVSLVGLSGFLAIAWSPSWFKIATASLPALIVFVWLVGSSSGLHRAVRGLLWASALAVAVAEPVLAQTDWHGILDAPVGRVALPDRDRYQVSRWVWEHTKPSEFLLEGGDTDLYFLLGLRDPAETPFLTPTDYTRPEQVQRLVRALAIDDVRLTLWPVELDLGSNRDTDHLGPLRRYLHDRYRVVKTFDDGTQAWERR